jgi:CheY-like chemotaxis protein
MTKILAVEDEPDITLALRLIFERAGYHFISCANGRSGLRMVHEEKPDLVLLDVGLPGMDGWTVLERIRDLADLPVLMLSAHGQEIEKVRGLRAGADEPRRCCAGPARRPAVCVALRRCTTMAWFGSTGGQGPSTSPRTPASRRHT